MSDCETVEPALKLPAHSRTRSKLFHLRPIHCFTDHTADTCTQCYDDDETCVNNNLSSGALHADGTAHPSEHLIDVDHLYTSPSVLMCRGMYTDDETEANSTPPGISVRNSSTHTTAEANNNNKESPCTSFTVI